MGVRVGRRSVQERSFDTFGDNGGTLVFSAA